MCWENNVKSTEIKYIHHNKCFYKNNQMYNKSTQRAKKYEFWTFFFFFLHIYPISQIAEAMLSVDFISVITKAKPNCLIFLSTKVGQRILFEKRRRKKKIIQSTGPGWKKFFLHKVMFDAVLAPVIKKFINHLDQSHLIHQ